MLDSHTSIDKLRKNPVLPFPPYRYIPGQSPHPFRSPQGHNHTQKTLKILEGHPQRDQRLFLYGMELLNAHFFWEAHETLEFLWLKANGEQKELLQALIKSAASLLKLHMDHIDAAENLWNSAVQLLRKKTIPNIDLEHFKMTITHLHDNKTLDVESSLFKEL